MTVVANEQLAYMDCGAFQKIQGPLSVGFRCAITLGHGFTEGLKLRWMSLG